MSVNVSLQIVGALGDGVPPPPPVADPYFLEFPVVSRLSQAEIRAYVHVLREIAPQPLQSLEVCSSAIL